MRLEKKSMATLLIAIFMISTFAVAMTVSADPVNLLASGVDGDEDSIVIEMPVDFTLGELMTISYSVFTRTGYPPHVDIILGTDIDGIPDNIDSLTAELAVNSNPDGKHWSVLKGELAYDEWLMTFELDTGVGDALIDGDTVLWVTRHGAGNEDAPYGTLNELKLGTVHYPDREPDFVPPPGWIDPDITIDDTVVVLRLEIEVDYWSFRDGAAGCDAVVDHIRINSQPATSITGYARPPMTSISVTPSDIDFGEIVLGQAVDVEDVFISNTGETTAHITAELFDDEGFYATSLRLQGGLTPSFSVDLSSGYTSFPVNLRLDVDRYAEAGVHTAVLVFWAEEA